MKNIIIIVLVYEIISSTIFVAIDLTTTVEMVLRIVI